MGIEWGQSSQIARRLAAAVAASLCCGLIAGVAAAGAAESTPIKHVVVILQENPDGYRTLSDAKRVWPDGRVEQLGWPRAEISYRTGTRHPESARIHLEDRAGTPLALDVETVTSVPLHVGAGYGGDPDWSHGRWMGRGWSQASVYDLTDPAVAGRIPFGVIDHLARALFAGEEGWGLFEHASMGRHDPTGFADWSSVAP